MSFSDLIFLPLVSFVGSFLAGYVMLAVYAFIKNSV